MKFLLSFGKIEIKYILMMGIAIGLIFLKENYSLYSDEKEEILKNLLDKEENYENPNFENPNFENTLLKSLLKYIGFSLMFIGDIIIKIMSSRKRKNFDKNLLVSKKYNLTKKDSKYLIKKKDILFILLISLANLCDELLAIFIKILTKEESISFDEPFISLEFFFLFISSFYIFKVDYYKHQYISIIIIISLEIFRLVIKLIAREYKYFLKKIGLQIIRAILHSLFIGYSKGLMEYKYFSPYKALYIFGFINGVIIIIIYCIVSFKPVKNGDLCQLIYEKKCYFDNFKSIFKEFTFNQFLGLFLYMISVAGTKLLFNKISNDFTICHIFTYYSIYSFYEIIDSFDGDEDIIIFALKLILSIFEIFITLIFLEIIVINLWGLNKNVKINIEKRAILDRDINENNINSTFDIDDDYELDFEDINKNINSLMKTQLAQIKDKEVEEEKINN